MSEVELSDFERVSHLNRIDNLNRSLKRARRELHDQTQIFTQNVSEIADLFKKKRESIEEAVQYYNEIKNKKSRKK